MLSFKAVGITAKAMAKGRGYINIGIIGIHARSQQSCYQRAPYHIIFSIHLHVVFLNCLDCGSLQLHVKSFEFALSVA